MSTNKQEKLNFWDKLKIPYRANVIEESSLREKRSFRFTGLHILGVLLAIILSTLLLVLLALFSPIGRSTLIGQQEIESSSAFIKLNKQLLELEEMVIQQGTYISGMQKMLVGDIQTVLESNPEKVDLDESQFVEQNPHIHEKTKKVNVPQVKAELKHLIPPLKGKISAHFEQSLDHYGIDIIASKGSAIQAIADGVVVQSGWNLDTGNTLSIQHKDNLISVYAHNSSLLKETGDYVSAGEAVAIIGNSGELTSGPHLHFELWLDGTALNPAEFIPF